MYIDRNAALSPRSPLEPLFRAVAAEKPDFAVRSVDVVTDRNNLRKLLRFVRASSRDSFQIRVEMVGDRTALFCRVEPRTTEMIVGFRGFGHNFEKAYTKNEGRNAAYHRIVSYDFAGLRFLVRHETDAYVVDGKPTRLVQGPGESVDDLADALKGLSIPKSDKLKTTDPEKTSVPFAVETGGRVVNISSTLEIKTKAASRGPLDMAETFPQLWIAQTPNLVVAYHMKGVFVDVKMRDATDDIRKWEAENKESLHGLSQLLKELIRLVSECPGRRAVVEYDGGDQLRIVGGQGAPLLPDDLYAMWGEEDEEKKSNLQHAGTTYKHQHLSTSLG